MSFVNADRIAATAFGDEAECRSYDAARLASGEAADLVTARADFCFETVSSHPSKVDLIAQAKAAGHVIHFVIIHLGDPALHIQRVRQRVAGGGHSVPEQKIVQRLPRVQTNLRAAVPLCDDVIIYRNYMMDTHTANRSFALVIRTQDGIVSKGQIPLPRWVLEYMPAPPEAAVE